MLSEKISSIFKKINRAALRAGRDPEEIKLIAVTKSQSTDKIKEAIDYGLRVFGENRVQEAKKKIIELKDFNVQWHMIGHLQSNKVKDAVNLFELIHSLDSEKLARLIDKEAEKAGKVQRVLIQVKLSEEETKFGIREEEIQKLIKFCLSLKNVKIEGLMTIPPFFEDPEKVRPYFRRLRQLRDRLVEKGYDFIRELSMGMSHDFEVAIEEGSTMIRIGTALFGQRIN